MRNLTDDAAKVWACLGLGIRNAKLSNEIAKECDLPRERTDYYMRRIARHLNLMGFEIVSDSVGFWRAEYPEEVEGYRLNLAGRSGSIMHRCAALDRIAARMRGAEKSAGGQG